MSHFEIMDGADTPPEKELFAHLNDLNNILYGVVETEYPQEYRMYQEWKNEQQLLQSIVGSDMQAEALQIKTDEWHATVDNNIEKALNSGEFSTREQARIYYLTLGLNDEPYVDERPAYVDLVEYAHNQTYELLLDRFNYYSEGSDTTCLGFNTERIRLEVRKPHETRNIEFNIELKDNETHISSITTDFTRYAEYRKQVDDGTMSEAVMETQLNYIYGNGEWTDKYSGVTIQDVYGVEDNDMLWTLLYRLDSIKIWVNMCQMGGLKLTDPRVWDL